MALHVARRAWHHDQSVMCRIVCAWTARLEFVHCAYLHGFAHDLVGVRRVAQRSLYPNALVIVRQPIVLEPIESSYLVKDNVDSILCRRLEVSSPDTEMPIALARREQQGVFSVFVAWTPLEAMPREIDREASE